MNVTPAQLDPSMLPALVDLEAQRAPGAEDGPVTEPDDDLAGSEGRAVRQLDRRAVIVALELGFQITEILLELLVR